MPITVADSASFLRKQLRIRSPRQETLLLSVLLFLFSLGIYAGSLRNDFVWDDVGVFVEDPSIREFRNIPGFFLAPLVLGQPLPDDSGIGGERIRYYRPLTSALHVLEYRWFGARPVGYKAANLILNGLVVVCAFLLVREVWGRAGPAFFAALLYAAIPARGEVVYWAYSDSHALAALFSLLALLAYHHRRFWLAFSGMVVALLFQEGAILVAAVLVVNEILIARANRDEWWGCRRWLPFVLLAGGYLALRRLIAGALPVPAIPIDDWLRGIAYLLVKYTKIFLVPDAPVTMYLYALGKFSPTGIVGAGTLMLAGLLLVSGFLLWRFNRALFFWYAWFFIWIAPSFNIGGYASYLMAEKGLYLAALGPCVLLAHGVASLPGRWRQAAFGFFLVLVGWQAVQTMARAPHWADSTTYLEGIVAFEPAYDVAHYQLAVLAMQGGRYDKAIGHLDRVLALRPDLQDGLNGILASAYAEKGRALAERGDLAQALADLETARRHAPGRSSIYNALGVVHYLRGDAAMAVSHWQKAVAVDPGNSEARENLRRYDPPGGRP